MNNLNKKQNNKNRVFLAKAKISLKHISFN